jgi:hypothetical protein
LFWDLSQNLLRPASDDTVGNSHAIGVGIEVYKSDVGGEASTDSKISASRRHTVGSEPQDVGECQRVGVGVNHVCVSVEGQNAVGGEEVGRPLDNAITINHNRRKVGLGKSRNRSNQQKD